MNAILLTRCQLLSWPQLLVKPHRALASKGAHVLAKVCDTMSGNRMVASPYTCGAQGQQLRSRSVPVYTELARGKAGH